MPPYTIIKLCNINTLINRYLEKDNCVYVTTAYISGHTIIGVCNNEYECFEYICKDLYSLYNINMMMYINIQGDLVVCRSGYPNNILYT
jgi:hypothetical protein